MRKRIIIPTALAALIGGYAFTQTSLFSSAEQASVITASEAKKIALEQFNGNIVEFEYDRDDLVPRYDFEIKKDNEKVELSVNAQTGEAILKGRETLPAGNVITNTIGAVESTVEQAVANTQVAVQQVLPSKQIATDDFISKADAIAIAQQHATGTLVKVELDAEDVEYEIELKDGRTEYDLTIDARTGTVLASETDYED